MPAREPHWGDFTYEDLARSGRLLSVICRGCFRHVYFLPADLIPIYGNMDARSVPFGCGHCGTGAYMQVKFRQPEPGDYGHLRVRRPSRLVTTQLWRTERLGDAPKRELTLEERLFGARPPAPGEVR